MSAGLHIDKSRIVNEYSYGPFGELLGAVARTHNPFGYVGRFGVMEEADGLVFMRARYYDDATGRFLTKDLVPGDMARPQSLNRYTYAQNDPVNKVDPFGLQAGVVTPEGPLPIYIPNSGPQLAPQQYQQMQQDLSGWFNPLSQLNSSLQERDDLLGNPAYGRPNEPYPGQKWWKRKRELNQCEPDEPTPEKNPPPPILPTRSQQLHREPWWSFLLRFLNHAR